MFFKSVVSEHITCKEASVGKIEDLGISISVPENSLSPTEEGLELVICPCFSGPFQLPDGYEAASLTYLIKESPKTKFLKEMTLRMQHYISLQSQADCDDMEFFSASSIPESEDSRPVYTFRKIEGFKGNFKPGCRVGEISLTHFCLVKVAIGTKRKRESNDYSKESEDLKPESKGMSCNYYYSDSFKH